MSQINHYNIKLLVVIVTFNAEKYIVKCIDSVLKSNLKSDIIIIDNNSTDNTITLLKEYGNKIRVIINKENTGFGRANNLGFAIALKENYDYVYLLNQDAYIFPDTLLNLCKAMEYNPIYGILSPLQLQSNEIELESGFKKIYDDHINKSLVKKIFEVPYCMAANWLISRDILLKVGGFSDSFFHYGEDWNYCERVRFHKNKVGILSSAKAVHDREQRN